MFADPICGLTWTGLGTNVDLQTRKCVPALDRGWYHKSDSLVDYLTDCHVSCILFDVYPDYRSCPFIKSNQTASYRLSLSPSPVRSHSSPSALVTSLPFAIIIQLGIYSVNLGCQSLSSYVVERDQTDNVRQNEKLFDSRIRLRIKMVNRVCYPGSCFNSKSFWGLWTLLTRYLSISNSTRKIVIESESVALSRIFKNGFPFVFL